MRLIWLALSVPKKGDLDCTGPLMSTGPLVPEEGYRPAVIVAGRGRYAQNVGRDLGNVIR